MPGRRVILVPWARKARLVYRALRVLLANAGLSESPAATGVMVAKDAGLSPEASTVKGTYT